MVANGTDAIPHGGCLCRYVCIFIFLARTRIGGQGSYGPELANNPEVRARIQSLATGPIGLARIILYGDGAAFYCEYMTLLQEERSIISNCGLHLQLMLHGYTFKKKKGLHSLTKDLLFGVEL